VYKKATKQKAKALKKHRKYSIISGHCLWATYGDYKAAFSDPNNPNTNTSL